MKEQCEEKRRGQLNVTRWRRQLYTLSMMSWSPEPTSYGKYLLQYIYYKMFISNRLQNFRANLVVIVTTDTVHVHGACLIIFNFIVGPMFYIKNPENEHSLKSLINILFVDNSTYLRLSNSITKYSCLRYDI